MFPPVIAMIARERFCVSCTVSGPLSRNARWMSCDAGHVTLIQPRLQRDPDLGDLRQHVAQDDMVDVIRLRFTSHADFLTARSITLPSLSRNSTVNVTPHSSTDGFSTANRARSVVLVSDGVERSPGRPVDCRPRSLNSTL